MDSKEKVKQQQSRILESLMGWEQVVGALYARYAEMFPGVTEFWLRLAREEEGHAKQLGSLRILLREGHVFWNIGRFREEAIQDEVDVVKKALDGTEAGRQLALAEALETAGQIEDSILEAGFYDTVESEVPEFAKVARTLADATRQHAERISALLNDARGADRPNA